MRAFTVAALAAAIAFSTASCNRTDSGPRDESSARRAGRRAYEFSKDTKKAAKEAEEELHKAEKELREGWNEAKHEDQARKTTRK